MKKSLKPALIGLIIVLAILGVAALKTYDTQLRNLGALAGTSWKLFTLNGEPSRWPNEITLDFTESTISGTDGCNSFSAGYRLKGRNLRVEQNQVVSTMMLCAGPSMDELEMFWSALFANPAVSLAGDQLILTSADGQILVFQAQ